MRPPPSPQALLADGSDVGPRSWDYGGSRPRQTIVLCKHLAITLSDDQHELLLQIADTLTAAARTRADPVPGSSSLQQTGAAAALDGAEFRHPRPVCRCSLLSPPPPFLARRQIAHLGAGAFVPLLQAPRVRRPASRGGGIRMRIRSRAECIVAELDLGRARGDVGPAACNDDRGRRSRRCTPDSRESGQVQAV